MTKFITAIFVIAIILGLVQSQILRGDQYNEFIESPRIETQENQRVSDYQTLSRSPASSQAQAKEELSRLSQGRGDEAPAAEILNAQNAQFAAEASAAQAKMVAKDYYWNNYLFNLQYNGKQDICNRCKKFEYFAFKRQGTSIPYYLTAYPSYLKFDANTAWNGPTSRQLFIGYQQIDGTWAFRTRDAPYRFIRADGNLNTINYQTFIGPYERWYMQRHGDHVHVQSAQFSNQYWAYGGGSTLRQLTGGAVGITVVHFPNIDWLWNN